MCWYALPSVGGWPYLHTDVHKNIKNISDIPRLFLIGIFSDLDKLCGFGK